MPWNSRSKEFTMVAAGAVVFTVATIALCYFLISAPPSHTIAYTVSYTLLGLTEMTSFSSFVIGMYLLHHKRRREIAEVVEDLKSVKPIVVEEVDLQQSEVTSLDYITQVGQELPPLFEALTELLEAFVIGYWGTKELSPNLNNVGIAIDMIAQQIDAFLQNPQEVLRVAIGIAAYHLIDQEKMGTLLRKSIGQVIAQLPDILQPSEPGFEIQGKLIKQILQVIAQQANISDDTVEDRVEALKNAYAKMEGADGEKEVEETMALYKGALIALIDTLFLKADLSADRIDTWTAHLVPPFLEKWKGSLFQKISSYMMLLHDAFEANGVFNDWWWRKKIQAGTTFPERAIYPKIKKAILTLPLTSDRQNALQKAVETLLPVIIDPFYYGTFDPDHVYRKKVKAILGSADFACPEVVETDWKAYVDAYAAFFGKLAEKLKAP